MSDTWSDIQAFKSKQSSFRERLQRRKKERENIVLAVTGNTPVEETQSSQPATTTVSKSRQTSPIPVLTKDSAEPTKSIDQIVNITEDPSYEELEEKLLIVLCDVALNLPIDSRALVKQVTKALGLETKVSHVSVENLLQKLSAQELIKVKESLNPEGETCLVVSWADHTKLQAVSNEYTRKGERSRVSDEPQANISRKRKAETPETESKEEIPDVKSTKTVVGSSVKDSGVHKLKDKNFEESIESLLSLPSAREKETKKVGAEILELLSRPTAKEKSLVERFRSQGGAQVQEFCPHGIKEECKKVSGGGEGCRKLHFKKIIQKHTDEALGDCSFLNTCFHMDTCKYVHYEVDYSSTGVTLAGGAKSQAGLADERLLGVIPGTLNGETVLYPTQWIQCDLRFFDMSILGKFAVIMADPPWDIHMELPYGTMSDDEMRQLNVPGLQDEGLIFLWVTGRAMELGRECLRLWGYTRCDEIIWVKTNQLQRIIRTGRTGHWLNHGKEHCLVGVKGNVEKFNRGLDCDVIVAEVRATSHKPDEIYGIIERLSPGTRKIELFGRPHNVQPNWMTLGNQLDGARLHDPALIEAFNRRYPDQNCMKKPD